MTCRSPCRARSSIWACWSGAGLLSRSKQGRVVTMHLERDELARAEEWLHRTRTFWTGQLANLAGSFPSPATDEEQS